MIESWTAKTTQKAKVQNVDFLGSILNRFRQFPSEIFPSLSQFTFVPVNRPCLFDLSKTHAFIGVVYLCQGCFLLIYLIYPDNIKHKSKNFPFCPENKTIVPNNFTEYMKEHVPKQFRPTSKLICDQTNKEYYIVHYGNLKFCIRMGMIISKVHRIVSFDQSPWLEKYIDYNTKKRAQADSDFKKDYHKYLICSFFGKTWKMLEIGSKLNLLKTQMRGQFPLEFFPSLSQFTFVPVNRPCLFDVSKTHAFSGVVLICRE